AAAEPRPVTEGGVSTQTLLLKIGGTFLRGIIPHEYETVTPIWANSRQCRSRAHHCAARSGGMSAPAALIRS
ncbi:MAG: hypothetical protein M3P51_08720, partial [Chloroflexota bacterium]|nr:hypothetical protein [Chloroflexota bacterium]